MSRTWSKIQYFKKFDHKMAIFFRTLPKIEGGDVDENRHFIEGK